MEQAEEMLSLARRANDLVEEARSLIYKAMDIPVRTGEWIDAATVRAQRDSVWTVIGAARAETEVLVDVVDGCIGADGRLF